MSVTHRLRTKQMKFSFDELKKKRYSCEHILSDNTINQQLMQLLQKIFACSHTHCTQWKNKILGDIFINMSNTLFLSLYRSWENNSLIPTAHELHGFPLQHYHIMLFSNDPAVHNYKDDKLAEVQSWRISLKGTKCICAATEIYVCCSNTESYHWSFPKPWRNLLCCSLPHTRKLRGITRCSFSFPLRLSPTLHRCTLPTLP